MAVLLVPLAASAQTVLLLGDDFEGADLSHKNLRGADLGNKNLKDANLSNSRLHRARLVNLPGAELEWAALLRAECQAKPGRTGHPGFGHHP